MSADFDFDTAVDDGPADTVELLSPTTIADSGLLARLAARDSRAMPEVIDRFGGLLWSLALRSSHGMREDAEDAVQEILMDLWRHADRYDATRGSELHFVSMLARRRLTDRFRGRVPEALPLEYADQAVDDPALVHADWELDFRRLLPGLAQLRPEERGVIEMGYAQGLSQSEIAESTGMPVGTVKSLMRRGMIRLSQWTQMLDLHAPSVA